jgi:hypothetical protein
MTALIPENDAMIAVIPDPGSPSSEGSGGTGQGLAREMFLRTGRA